MPSGEELVQAYLEHFRTRDDALLWAFNDMADLVRHAPERAWPLIVALTRAAPDERTMFYVAAGPLEDILCWHGPTMWPRIYVDARRDPRLRWALSGVWGSTSMDPTVWSELQAFLGPVPPATPQTKK